MSRSPMSGFPSSSGRSLCSPLAHQVNSYVDETISRIFFLCSLQNTGVSPSNRSCVTQCPVPLSVCVCHWNDDDDGSGFSLFSVWHLGHRPTKNSKRWYRAHLQTSAGIAAAIGYCSYDPREIAINQSINHQYSPTRSSLQSVWAKTWCFALNSLPKIKK